MGWDIRINSPAERRTAEFRKTEHQPTERRIAKRRTTERQIAKRYYPTCYLTSKNPLQKNYSTSNATQLRKKDRQRQKILK
jgi:hypothetical protein